jgi:hypothetical protein
MWQLGMDIHAYRFRHMILWQTHRQKFWFTKFHLECDCWRKCQQWMLCGNTVRISVLVDSTIWFLNGYRIEKFPDKMFERCIIFVENAIKVQCNVVTWYGHSYLQTPPPSSLGLKFSFIIIWPRKLHLKITVPLFHYAFNFNNIFHKIVIKVKNIVFNSVMQFLSQSRGWKLYEGTDCANKYNTIYMFKINLQIYFIQF